MRDLYRNREILDKAGVEYTTLHDGFVLKFSCPEAIYYPDNNKWKSGFTSTHSYYGNAYAFLAWLEEE